MEKKLKTYFWNSSKGKAASAAINRKIADIYLEASRTQEAQKIAALKNQAVREVGDICRKFGTSSLNWTTIKNRAGRLDQNLIWPRVRGDKMMVSNQQVLRIAIKIVGVEPPATITTAQRTAIQKKSHLSRVAVNCQLRFLGYSAPRTTADINDLIRKTFARAQTLASKEEADALKIKLEEQVEEARKKIGLPSVRWHAIADRASRQEPKIPGWPRLPQIVIAKLLNERKEVRENPHW